MNLKYYLVFIFLVLNPQNCVHAICLSTVDQFGVSISLVCRSVLCVDQFGNDQMGHYRTVDQLTQLINLAVEQSGVVQVTLHHACRLPSTS